MKHIIPSAVLSLFESLLQELIEEYAKDTQSDELPCTYEELTALRDLLTHKPSFMQGVIEFEYTPIKTKEPVIDFIFNNCIEQNGLINNPEWQYVTHKLVTKYNCSLSDFPYRHADHIAIAVRKLQQQNKI